MKAMILAAGEGRRMRPLTERTPKPLLKVGNHSLIELQIEKLRLAGVDDLVVNTAYLGQQIKDALGDGKRLGVRIAYSEEPEPLETGGALHRARELLGDDLFLMVNSDIWMDYPLERLKQLELAEGGAHLVLVGNPEHHATGDFALSRTGYVLNKDATRSYTFSGLSLISPKLIDDYPHKRLKFPLIEILRWAIAEERLTGEYYPGQWLDIGTPERLATLERMLAARTL